MFHFQNYTAENGDGFQNFRQTMQLPSSRLMTLGGVWQILYGFHTSQYRGREAVIKLKENQPTESDHVFREKR
jgi:hypothetical protein